jgi:hypothetical protein
MRYFALFLVLFGALRGLTQSVSPVERNWVNAPTDLHTDVKSLAQDQLDSIRWNEDKSRFCFGIHPDVLVAAQYRDLAARTGLHLSVNSRLGKPFSFVANYRVGYANLRTIPYTSPLQPKAYFSNSLSGNQSIYHDLRGRVAFTPNKVIQLQAGLDHIFIGEGDRSLFSGNQGIPAPFVQLKVHFWKLEYHLIQQIWREQKASGSLAPKGNATHYLSFKPTKNWSFGIFETVVYGMKDTLYNRGFEVEYLNPLLFFRPQEYGLGSSDNVLLGFQTSFQWKKNMLYGQFLLDEFLLAEIKAGNGWWANKFGVQLGYKGWTDRGASHLFYRTELNLLRPFTYSQVQSNIVYGNQGLPVAHPLGSNFIELYQEVAWQRNDWKATAFLQYYLKGNDSLPTGNSYGGNIYQPYNQRPGDYGFHTGSGVPYHVMQLGMQVSRTLIQRMQVDLFVEPRVLFTTIHGTTFTDFFGTVGVYMPLGSDRRNY